MKYAIHWFRRDLRVAGNPALQKNWKDYNGKVVGIFNFDRSFLARQDFSHTRFHFFLKTLEALQQELRSLGSDLLFTDGSPEVEIPRVLHELKNKSTSRAPDRITWCRDYEPFARKRDEKILKILQADNFSVENFSDHLVLEPGQVMKSFEKKEAYQVYSPFARRWHEAYAAQGIQKVGAQTSGLEYLQKMDAGLSIEKKFSLSWNDLLPEASKESPFTHWLEETQKKSQIDLPKAGSLAAYRCMKNFTSTIDSYSESRDFPWQEGTSKLSIYLKNGSIVTSQVLKYFDLQSYKKAKTGRDKFFSELIWREFYYHILWHYPYVETSAFNPKFEHISWENNPDWFERWKEGQTGYPIVDAAMRQLNTTGWMHNRLRMIVASFLTKDLLIDWKWGEKYFMEKLLDGDLAPNNGGWQWAASTGCDPQPYFRIFNPELQSLKFDDKGIFIKKYVPELNGCPIEEIHNPVASTREKLGYPPPLVDHQTQKAKALRLYGLPDSN